MAADAPTAAERSAAGVRAARALGDSRNYLGAVDTLRRVLGEDPEHLEAQYLLGLFLHNLGRHDEALAACRAAVALAPENPIAHRLLGIALGARVFSKAKGLAHHDEAVRLAPTDGYNHYFRARALVGLARPKQAMAAYLEACDKAPAEAMILAGTAEFLFANRRHRQAREFAARAFAADPDDPGALTAEARSRLGRGRAADARDLARAAVAANATNRAALEVMIEAEMCRNPVFAVWSRVRNWCRGGSWRGTLFLIGSSQVMLMVLVAAAAFCPGCDVAAPFVVAICVMLALSPGIILQKRVQQALRPVRLRKRF